MNSKPRSDPHRDVGRRLYAAVLSAEFQIGMDYTLENYTPEEIDASWGELGAMLQQGLNRHVVDYLNKLRNAPAQKGS